MNTLDCQVDLCSLEMSSATVTEDQPAGKGSQVYMSDQEFKEYIKRRDQEVQHMLLALQKASKVRFMHMHAPPCRA